MISTKIVKGFKDYLPKEEEARDQLISKLKATYHQMGYRAIDTPTIEYSETLLEKSGGETEKQVFRFTDQGGRDVALRFDLTVPFARFMAMHKEQLGIPFKRYHVGKAFRGENPQKGRFREFIQCDFDIVGSNSLAADCEVLLTAYHALTALELEQFTININHRALFSELLKILNLEQHLTAILHIIDKTDKIGRPAIEKELLTFVDAAASAKILQFITVSSSNAETLANIGSLIGENSEGFKRLAELYSTLKELGLEKFFVINPAISRGLDYYTGLVFETFLTEFRAIGSICSGGRYDNLLAYYQKPSETPLGGVGGSVGVDRLLAALAEMNASIFERKSQNRVFLEFQHGQTTSLIQIREEFLKNGLQCEFFLNEKKFEQQLKYALRNDYDWFLSINNDQTYRLKNLHTKSDHLLTTLAEVSAIIHQGKGN